MLGLSRLVDAGELSAVFDDHREAIYLGAWKELVIGDVRLVRREDDSIEVERVEEDALG